jgi:p24 family protein alpha
VVMQSALLLLALALCANAATFRIKDNLPVCFVEEVSYGSDSVVGRYERKRNPSVNNVAVKFSVTSPRKEIVIHQTETKTGINTFSFKPHPEDFVGFYTMCFTVTQFGWKSTSDIDFIEFNFEVDHHDRVTILPKPEPSVTRQKVHKNDEVFVFTDFDGQQKETLRTHDYIERVNRLLSQIAVTAEEVANEVKYFEERTLRMRTTTESTFDRVWVCAVFTIIAILGISWIQFSFLKSFLKRKKLV